jgi:hypothetical protein
VGLLVFLVPKRRHISYKFYQISFVHCTNTGDSNCSRYLARLSVRIKRILLGQTFGSCCETTPSRIGYSVATTATKQVVDFLHSCLEPVQTVVLCRSWLQRSHILRRRSAVSRLLRLWVRIPPGGTDLFCCESCVLSGRGLCDKLIARLEESYRMWCVVVCDVETLKMGRPWPALGRSTTGGGGLGGGGGGRMNNLGQKKCECKMLLKKNVLLNTRMLKGVKRIPLLNGAPLEELLILQLVNKLRTFYVTGWFVIVFIQDSTTRRRHSPHPIHTNTVTIFLGLPVGLFLL